MKSTAGVVNPQKWYSPWLRLGEHHFLWLTYPDVYLKKNASRPCLEQADMQVDLYKFCYSFRGGGGGTVKIAFVPSDDRSDSFQKGIGVQENKQE